jgi:hypothetical protein
MSNDSLQMALRKSPTRTAMSLGEDAALVTNDSEECYSVALARHRQAKCADATLGLTFAVYTTLLSLSGGSFEECVSFLASHHIEGKWVSHGSMFQRAPFLVTLSPSNIVTASEQREPPTVFLFFYRGYCITNDGNGCRVSLPQTGGYYQVDEKVVFFAMPTEAQRFIDFVAQQETRPLIIRKK